jgi:UDP-N-acetylmuramyl pentapeptide synthase
MQVLEQKQIENHFILIKGSRGIKLEKVITLL